jgi:hypothetical protein
MANEMIKFLRGNVASLPANATPGAVYFTKDEGLYLGLEDGTYHRYGDFITVNDVASLPADGAHETCMYYCVAENVLAKWNGTSWTQINKQKTLAELGGVAKSVYDAKMAALEKADTDNATAISGVDDRLKVAEEKLKSVATTEGLGELTDRVGEVETDIDNLQAAIAEGGSVANAIAEAKQAGLDAAALAGEKTTMAAVEAKNYATKDEAQSYANAKDEAIAAAQTKANDAYTLADGKATMEQVNAAIAGAGHAVKSEVDTAIENLDKAYKAADVTLQGNIDKKVDIDTYNAKVAELAGADTTLQGNIDALAGKVGTPTEGKTIVQMIADAQTAATYDDTQVKADIKANADAIDAIEADYLKKADKDGLQEQITANANAITLLTNGVSADEVDGVNDLIKYVKEHGTEVTGMQESIAANAKAIADQATSDAATYETKEDAGKKLTEAKAYTDTEVAKDRERLVALEAIDHDHSNKGVLDGITAEKVSAWDASEQNAKDYADGKITDLKIGDYVKKTDADATYAVIGHNHDDKYDAKGDAAQALVDAKAYVDGKDSAMNTRVEALEAIDHEHANKAELDKIADGDVAKWNAAQANAEATAAGAIAAAKTELEGKITSGNATTLASAEAKATELDNALKTTLQAEIDADVKALEDTVYKKSETFTKDEINALFTWGSF